MMMNTLCVICTLWPALTSFSFGLYMEFTVCCMRMMIVMMIMMNIEVKSYLSSPRCFQ